MPIPSDFSVNVINYPSQLDWCIVYALATDTMGKNNWHLEKEVTREWKEKMLNCEHSPIRHLNWIIRLENIPYCYSVHFVRHKHGVEHYVRSQRNDRQNDYDREAAPQNAPVNHTMEVNAQELMFMARKRLCGKASLETRQIMRHIVSAVIEKNPEMKRFLQPNCKIMGRCTEFQSCGLTPCQMPPNP